MYHIPSLVLVLTLASLGTGAAGASSREGEPRVAADATSATDNVDVGLASYLAKRYRRAVGDVARYVSAARRAGDATELDPLLLLAVMAVESSFDPAAESGFGAQGLMQVVPRFHRETVKAHGGIAALRDPHVNIAVGARILRDYIAASGGLVAGLQRYAGARSDGRKAYARRVLAERERLREVIDPLLQADA